VDIHRHNYPNGEESIRYMIEVDYKGKKYKGWVHGAECIL